MKTKMDEELFQYHIWLDKEDMDRLKKNGAISIDTHRDIPGFPFIHIIATKELRNEPNNED